MINGHQMNGSTTSLNYSSTGNNNSTNSKSIIASLYNLGNTCYLNSVLYTLRYSPGLISNIHHLVKDLSLSNVALQNKHKSSSLGRNVPSFSATGYRSSSSKDLLSLGNARNESKPDYQILVEELHDLYTAMRNLEIKNISEAHRPSSFTNALAERNKIFEGSKQHDAHELLVCLLDSIRDTCQDLKLREPIVIPKPEKISPKENKSFGLKRWRICKNSASDYTDDSSSESVYAESSRVEPVNNFISDYFEGVSLLRTICLECENEITRKEVFSDICVPINTNLENSDQTPDQIFKEACVTSELLQEQNKYYCENCFRYSEARRESCFEKLPNILVLHLKRFMTTKKGIEKIKYYMPTPFTLKCFCEECCCAKDGEQKHSYTLYSVIMHRGTAMAEGHYVSYVRESSHYVKLMNCGRLRDCSMSGDLSNLSINEKPTSGKMYRFFKSRNSTNGESGNKTSNLVNNSVMRTRCSSSDCCAIKLQWSQKVPNCNSNVTYKSPDVWLECNDDTIKTLTSREFEQQLENRNKIPATPYILFYVKDTKRTEGN